MSEHVAEIARRYPFRCATCRFWVLDEGDVYGPRDDGWKSCLRAGTWYGDNDEHKGARMATVSADNWGLALWTAPDYGCVEHQPGAASA